MRPKIPDATWDKVAELRKRGVSAQKAADDLGLHVKTVAKRYATLPKPCSFQVMRPAGKPAPFSIAQAKAVITADTKITIIPRATHKNSPICGFATEGEYRSGRDLHYRGMTSHAR